MERSLAPIPINMSLLPWFHVFGCMTLLGSAIKMQKVVVLPKFSALEFLSAIEVFFCSYDFI